MSRVMRIAALSSCAVAALAVFYVLFILWMAAGLFKVLLFFLVLNGGLGFARAGDRPLEEWPVLRHFLRTKL